MPDFTHTHISKPFSSSLLWTHWLPSPYWYWDAAPTQSWDLVLTLLSFMSFARGHIFGLSWSFWMALLPPSVFSSTQCQFCNAISKVAEDALSPTVCVSNKGTKQYSSPYSVLLRKATHHKASIFIYPMDTKSLTAALWKQPPIRPLTHVTVYLLKSYLTNLETVILWGRVPCQSRSKNRLDQLPLCTSALTQL